MEKKTAGEPYAAPGRMKMQQPAPLELPAAAREPGWDACLLKSLNRAPGAENTEGVTACAKQQVC